MAKLLIGYAGNRDAIRVTSPDPIIGHHYYDLIGGPASACFMVAPTGSVAFIYEFGSAVAMDSLFILYASRIFGPWATLGVLMAVSIETSSDGVSWATAASESNIDSSSMIGSRGTDYAIRFTEASAKFWRVTLSMNDTSRFSISKLWLCKAIDLGRDPNKIEFTNKIKAPTYSVDGNLIGNYSSVAPVTINLNWEGLSDANLVKFLGIINNHMHSNFMLYNEDDNLQLSGMRLLYGSADRISYSKLYRNYNQLGFVFSERS